MLNNFPAHLHPMSQFSAAVTACNTESLFAKAYSDGVHKSTYWEYAFEDSMRLIAKLPTIAAMIYRNLYRDASSVGAIDTSKDFPWKKSKLHQRHNHATRIRATPLSSRVLPQSLQPGTCAPSLLPWFPCQRGTGCR